jgi:ribosomal protein S27E
MIDLDAIRARDRDYDDVFEAQANMSKDIAHRLVAWPVADRRALLAYVDALQERLSSKQRHADDAEAEVWKIRAERDALRAAAGKVECRACYGVGEVYDMAGDRIACPDCADLRRLLEGKP